MRNLDSLIRVASEAMDVAAGLALSLRTGLVTSKGDRDMVSELDLAIEQYVREFLRERTPDIGFLGEEEGPTNQGADLIWALDPIDGTANLVHGLPLCGISLAVIHRSRPVLGLIDLPFLERRFSAVESQGAFADGRRLHASRTRTLDKAIVAIGDYAVGFDAAEKNRVRMAVTERLAAKALRVRMFGSAALDLAWLAEGRIDASITLSNKPWDVAAGVIIAREAGAHVVDRDGSEHTLDSAATIGVAPSLVHEVTRLVHEAESQAVRAAQR